jgi:hypothetical protein
MQHPQNFPEQFHCLTGGHSLNDQAESVRVGGKHKSSDMAKIKEQEN